MGLIYRCPRCRVVLNPKREVVLSGRLGRTTSLFLFEPETGNYNYTAGPEKKIKPGERWEFHCPACQQDLTSQVSADLAHLNMIDDDGVEHMVVFSKIASQHATFDLTQEKVESFGKDSRAYMDLFIENHYW